MSHARTRRLNTLLRKAIKEAQTDGSVNRRTVMQPAEQPEPEQPNDDRRTANDALRTIIKGRN